MGGVATIGEPEPSRRGRSTRLLVVAFIVIAVIAGLVLLVAGSRASDRASTTRDRVAVLRRERRALVARTAAAERDVDSPIGDAERVAKSVTTIVSASDTVIKESAATNQVLSQAVRLANRGRRDAANQIYEGQAADSVRSLQAALARAEAALAAAQQSTAALSAEKP
jgi:hypothetical protein